MPDNILEVLLEKIINNMKVDFKDIFLNDKAYIYSSGDITITGKEGTFTNKVGDIESEKNIKIE